MPTLVHMIGADEPLLLPIAYDEVIKAFQGREIAVFGEDGGRMAIFKTGVVYIQEKSE